VKAAKITSPTRRSPAAALCSESVLSGFRNVFSGLGARV